MADALVLIFLVSSLFVSGVTSRNITIENKCDYSVWPGIYTNNYGPPFSTTGFVLRKGEARVVKLPSSWTGRFWGRSFCSINSTGSFSCTTGDCGTGKVECSGASGTPPVTLAEFTLDSSNGQDFYDVSLVDGYNLPVLVAPDGDTRCKNTGCVADLNMTCPSELRVTSNTSSMVPIACMSACQRFKLAEFCCTGDYRIPDKCTPTQYSQNFKSACPRAYSYTYDNINTTFTCASKSNYVITFCPSTILNTSK